MGGVWERMVRTAKTLETVSTSRTPDEETFQTLLTEVEGIIIYRPLSFLPLGVEDGEALTLNIFFM